MKNDKPIPHLLRSGDFLSSMQDKDYQIPEEKLVYHKSFFAFIDILGFKNLLIEHKDKAPSIIFNIIKDAYLFHKSSYESIKLKILSDSILVWSDTDHQISFWNLINVVELLRGSFLKKGLLIRGGIAHGDNFIHNDIIVSPALSEAYQLEQIANYPRILISDTAKSIGMNNLATNGHRKGIIYEGYFRACDTDQISEDIDNQNILTPFLNDHGIYCLIHNIPGTYFPGDAVPTEDQIKLFKEAGIKALIETRENLLKARPATTTNEKVIEKHNYIATKFNDFIESINIDKEVELLPTL
jgi:hypothetical protein